MRPRSRRLLLAFAAALLVAGVPARAQESARPSLAGHTFVATDLIPDAFVRSYVRTSLGYAAAEEIDYPPLVLGGDTVLALQGSLTYATLGLEYQGAMREWIAARFAVNMVTRLGTQAYSLLNEGVTVTVGYDFGFLARLRETPKTTLSGTLGVSNQTSTFIDVRQFAEDIGNGIANARLIDDVPMVRPKAGLRYAWAASPSFGVTLLGESSYGDAPRRQDTTAWGWDLGASVDYDAGPKHDLPLGAALAFRLTSLPGLIATEDGTSSQTVLRLAYTGDREVIALDISGVFDRQNSKATPIFAGGAAFSMRIYF